MVPMLTCGFVRSNFAFATSVSSWTCWCLLKQCCYFSCAAVVTGQGYSVALASSLAGGLSDDLLRHVRRNFGVVVEHHGVVRPALSLRPQVADVAEHLRQRHVGFDNARAAAFLHGLDLATAGVQVADHVTHVVLGCSYLDGHDGLQDDQLCL